MMVVVTDLLLFCTCVSFVAPAESSISNFLPPLLRFENGSTVASKEEWWGRRSEVQGLLDDHILGSWPTDPIVLEQAVKINSSTLGPRNNGATSTFYTLTFNTSNGCAGIPNVSFDIELLSPGPSPGRSYPLFLTQWNHREWALLGLSRGYVSIVYPGGDTLDAAPDFQKAYPKATMMLIMARALVASKTLDLVFLDKFQAKLPNITRSHISITGHSRNGKQSLVAAAYDERITAVVGSSPGAPIASPYHLSSHNFYGEGPDAGQAGHWWLDRVVDYTAHPETLPMDGHGVLASIAPRHCAVFTGLTDHEGDMLFANEYAFKAAMTVYELFNATSHLRLFHRPGDHHGFIDVNMYFDFFDFAFGRQYSSFRPSWPGFNGEQMYLSAAGFDFDLWVKTYGDSIPSPPPSSAPISDRIEWLVQHDDGSAAAYVRSVGTSYAEEGSGRFSYRSVMMAVDYDRFGDLNRQSLSFGGYVTGNMYWQKNRTADAATPLPTVLWLHPYAYSTGYQPSYTEDVIENIARAGFAVFAYDQIGFATRLREGGSNFYARHESEASIFGNMIRDARAALDMLECLTSDIRNNLTLCGTGEGHTSTYPDLRSRIPNLDPSNFIVAGYSLGGNIALHTAALDKRVSAVASFSGFTPFRSDSNDRPTGGIKRLYDFHALIPRLGMFREDMVKIPYDYDEVLIAIAPRPTLLWTPRHDRDATYADVLSCILKAKTEWQKSSKEKWDVNHTAPDAYTDMGHNELFGFTEWAKKIQRS